MKAIAIKNNQGEIISSIVTEEFIGILTQLDRMVRFVSSSESSIDYGTFYDHDIWSIVNNENSMKLWELATAEFFAHNAHTQLRYEIEQTLKKFKPLPTAWTYDAVVDAEKALGYEIDDGHLDNKEIAQTIVQYNISQILDRVIEDSAVMPLPLRTADFSPLMGTNYWVNMEQFINTNWEEIYDFVEVLQTAPKSSLKAYNPITCSYIDIKNALDKLYNGEQN